MVLGYVFMVPYTDRWKNGRDKQTKEEEEQKRDFLGVSYYNKWCPSQHLHNHVIKSRCSHWSVNILLVSTWHDQFYAVVVCPFPGSNTVCSTSKMQWTMLTLAANFLPGGEHTKCKILMNLSRDTSSPKTQAS